MVFVFYKPGLSPLWSLTSTERLIGSEKCSRVDTIQLSEGDCVLACSQVVYPDCTTAHYIMYHLLKAHQVPISYNRQLVYFFHHQFKYIRYADFKLIAPPSFKAESPPAGLLLPKSKPTALYCPDCGTFLKILIEIILYQLIHLFFF